MKSKMQEDKENNIANMSSHSVLNAFDFTAIDEMDPSLGMKIFLNFNDLNNS
jgi:hypothetical protein